MALLVLAASCWLLSIVAIPSAAAFDDVIAYRVYCRLLGRQRRLRLLAIVMTVIALLACALAQPSRENPDLREARYARLSCTGASPGVFCYVGEEGGIWCRDCRETTRP